MEQLFGLLILFAVAIGLLVVGLTWHLVRTARRPPRNSAGYALARSLPCDPGDLGLTYEEWILHRPDGARLPVWEITTGLSPAVDGPALTAVLVHGWGQSRIDMLTRLLPWMDLCDRLVLYDLRGHGDATNGPTRLGHDEHHDLIALLEHLNAQRVMLVGASMGAVIALHAAAFAGSMKNRVAGVVAFGPYIDFHRSMRGRLDISRLPARPISDIAMLWFRLCGIRHRDLLIDASAVSAPALILHNRHDRVCPLGHSERLVDALPNARLETIDASGHLDQPDTMQHAIDRALRDFAAEVINSVEPDDGPQGQRP